MLQQNRTAMAKIAGPRIAFEKHEFRHTGRFSAFIRMFMSAEMSVIGWRAEGGKIAKIYAVFLTVVGLIGTVLASVTQKLSAVIPFTAKAGYKYLGYYGVGKPNTPLAGFRLFDVTGGFDEQNADDLTALELTAFLDSPVADSKTMDLFLTVPTKAADGKKVKTDSVICRVGDAPFNLTRRLGIHNARITEDGKTIIGLNRDGAFMMLMDTVNYTQVSAWAVMEIRGQRGEQVKLDGYNYIGRPRVVGNIVGVFVYDSGNTLKLQINRPARTAKITDVKQTGDVRVIDWEATDEHPSYALKDTDGGCELSMASAAYLRAQASGASASGSSAS